MHADEAKYLEKAFRAIKEAVAKGEGSTVVGVPSEAVGRYVQEALKQEGYDAEYGRAVYPSGLAGEPHVDIKWDDD
jgi:hypothetical protein